MLGIMVFSACTCMPSGFWPQWSFHWPLFQSMSAINIVILFIMFRMKLVGRVACFTPLVGFSPSGVVHICTVQVPFVCLLWLILIRRFFHDIYFRIVVSIDFVSCILQPCFQHVEHTRLKGLIQGLPAVLLKIKLEAPLPQQMLRFLIDCSRDTVDGNQIKPRMATLRIIFFLCCLFLCHWVFNLFFPFF